MCICALRVGRLRSRFPLLKEPLNGISPDTTKKRIPDFGIDSMAEFSNPALVIEAALLTSPQPLRLEDISRLFDGTIDKVRLLEEIGRLSEFWAQRNLRLVETAQGWRFQTTIEMGTYLARLAGQKPPKYSRAVMETLAIIAYRQPATRGDIEEIRGVAVNPNVVRQLEERGWIEIVGHRETPGRPSLFATTKQFLDDLGLKSLSDLPPIAGEMPQPKEFELNFGTPESVQPIQKEHASEEVSQSVIQSGSTETVQTDNTEVVNMPNVHTDNTNENY